MIKKLIAWPVNTLLNILYTLVFFINTTRSLLKLGGSGDLWWVKNTDTGERTLWRVVNRTTYEVYLRPITIHRWGTLTQQGIIGKIPLRDFNTHFKKLGSGKIYAQH